LRIALAGEANLSVQNPSFTQRWMLELFGKNALQEPIEITPKESLMATETTTAAPPAASMLDFASTIVAAYVSRNSVPQQSWPV
jgi:hypothetical protein